MKTNVITFATSKGGAGKSTLARNLAAHWINSGFNVAIIDADPQASILSRHDAEGPLKKLKVFSEPEESVHDLIEEIKNNFDFTLVDTGGFRNRTTIRALIATDLAIIPLKSSADDVSGAISTCELIRELNETRERINNPIKYRMILTMTSYGTVIARHIRSELEGIGYFILKTELSHRVAYPEAAIKGLSPCITDPDGPAARDIASIASEINHIINK